MPSEKAHSIIPEEHRTAVRCQPQPPQSSEVKVRGDVEYAYLWDRASNLPCQQSEGSRVHHSITLPQSLTFNGCRPVFLKQGNIWYLAKTSCLLVWSTQQLAACVSGGIACQLEGLVSRCPWARQLQPELLQKSWPSPCIVDSGVWMCAWMCECCTTVERLEWPLVRAVRLPFSIYVGNGRIRRMQWRFGWSKMSGRGL